MANPSKNHLIFSIVMVLIFGAISLMLSLYPQLFLFTADEESGRFEKYAGSSIHLADDVMIALRPGYMLNDTGSPSFNRTDLSQPATSYAVPYLYASIRKVM